MIEQILNHRNIMRAYRQVLSNKGSAGVDGMQVKDLGEHLKNNRNKIESEIRRGQYLPQAILGVEIPKSNGKTRLLGIPTVTDRLFQQATGQAIAVRFEIDFNDHSYGFRPSRNAQQAVLKAQEYINAGYNHIVDIDLKSFFDEVDHCILLQLLFRKIKCPITLRLIRKWLRTPIMIKGKLVKRRKGVPQGSPLSPLLSNIMLNELDKALEKQGLRYVRYADDFSIYARSDHAARKAGNHAYLFLRNKLKLPINREKSGIRKPVNFTILGYGFVPTYVKGEKGKIKDLDGWIRNRLRYCIWHFWKKPERRRKNLFRLGVDREHAYAWSRTRKGGWAVAQSPILGTTVTLDRLRKRGYEAMLDLYQRIAPHLNEPLYTRPVRTVV